MQWQRWVVPLALLAAISGLGGLFLPSEVSFSPNKGTMQRNGGPGQGLQLAASQATDRIISTDQMPAKLQEAEWAGDQQSEEIVLSSTEEAPSILGDAGSNELQASCVQPAALDPAIRQIRVNVATLWAHPERSRPKDWLSATDAPDIRGWLQSLSIKDKLWFVGQLETQALLGAHVKLLEERGNWSKVVVLEQETPRHSEGYPGWMPTSQLSAVDYSYDLCKRAVVSSPTAELLEASSAESASLEVSFNTVLPIIQADGDLLQVATPDGMRWIEKRSVRVAPSQESRAVAIEVTGDRLVETAKSFLQLPYLWAGTSGFGFDCSGFTYSVYRYYGISIPRDAKDQAQAGQAVDKKQLQPGDLLFFAYNKGKGKVHHVGMYVGEGLMIHSPKTERSVEIIPLSTPEYASEFAVARRFLP